MLYNFGSESISILVIMHSNEFHLNPFNAKLNPICHLLALLGAHHILHVSRIRVNKMKLFHVERRA